MSPKKSDEVTERRRRWGEVLRSYTHPRVLTMLFLGFSAGLPLWLIFSSLSIWLVEAGVDRSSITLFSWAALAYSFKFIWAPLVDRLPLPLLTRWLGRRRAWLLLSQCCVALAIAGMAFTDPAVSLLLMAIATVLLGFSSATQDIVIDAYRIESAPADLQATLSSSYIAGYRLGMLAAGAGVLKLAAALGGDTGYSYAAWRDAYLWMSAAMLVGVVTTLLVREPERALEPDPQLHSPALYGRFLLLFVLTVAAFILTFSATAEGANLLKAGLSSLLGTAAGGFLAEGLRLILALGVALGIGRLAVARGLVGTGLFEQTYTQPVVDFFHRYGRFAVLILLLVGCYRISDILLGVIANVFYTDMGYNKDQIANITKSFGLLMTLVGGFLGGGLALRFGVSRVLLLGAVLSAGSNLLFLLLARSEPTTTLLTLVITADNLSGGLATAAFVAYLSGLTNIAFTAFQYAAFSSLMTLFPKLLGGYSGAMVESLGYADFFILTTLLGLPVIALTWLAARRAARAPDDSPRPHDTSVTR